MAPHISLSGLLVSALLFCASENAHVFALIPDLPQQTSISDELFDPRGWSPRPTDPPNHRALNLFARQNFPDFPGDAEKVIVAPDNTCGFVSGLQGAPYSCDKSYKCLFFSATGTGYGPLACCTTGMSCAIRTACVGSAEYYNSASDGACNAGCKWDIYTLKCTESSEPYCGQIRFTNPNIQDFWCVSTNASSFHVGHTTYSNQTISRAYQTVDKAKLWPVSNSATLTTKSKSSSSSSSSDGTTSSQTSSDSPSPPTNTNSATPSPAGAIVGGVLGGIALLAAIGFGIFFLWRRYGHNNNRHHELSGGGGAFSPEPYATYPTPTEMDAGRFSHPMDPSTAYAGAGGRGNQAYDDPHKPQELYSPPIPILSAAKTGRYTQVPMDDHGGGGYYQQTKPMELESRSFGATPTIARPPNFPPGDGY